MKILILLAGALLNHQAFAANGDVMDLVQTSESQIQLTIDTMYFCDAPQIELVFDQKDAADVYHYHFNITSVAKMLCQDTQPFKATLSIPKDLTVGKQLSVDGAHSTSKMTSILLTVNSSQKALEAGISYFSSSLSSRAIRLLGAEVRPHGAVDVKYQTDQGKCMIQLIPVQVDSEGNPFVLESAFFPPQDC